MNRKWMIRIGVGVVALLAVAWLASPLFAVRVLVNAARQGDAATLERMVDFPAFRDSLKDELNTRLRSEMRRDLAKKDSALSGLGMMLAPVLVSGAVDAFVTPEAVAAMVQTAEAPDPTDLQPPEPKPTDGADDDIRRSYSYRGLNTFVVRLTDPDHADEPLDLLMERRGLFSWKLAGVDLPEAPDDAA